jgi:hypothetical protein
MLDNTLYRIFELREYLLEASSPERRPCRYPVVANPRPLETQLELETVPTNNYRTCAVSKLEAIWMPIESLGNHVEMPA